MAQNTIDEILEKRRQAEKPASPVPEPEQEDKFFSILVGEGIEEHFLELQLRDGVRLCFPYRDVGWFHFLPDDNCIDIEIGGFLISFKGRGLVPRLFNGLKQKRVAWVKEADHPMQDHKNNETFIEAITVIPPKEYDEQGEAE